MKTVVLNSSIVELITNQRADGTFFQQNKYQKNVTMHL